MVFNDVVIVLLFRQRLLCHSRVRSVILFRKSAFSNQ